MQQVPQSTTDIRLFQHSKRQHWGVAAFIWERDGKRGYQFSDGKMRVFKEGFYHLIQPTVAPGDGSAKAVRRLARLARADDVSEARRLPTLRDQISLFRRAFPEGFVGEVWGAKQRGIGARRRLKRHRDPVISDAHGLSPKQLGPLIERREWEAVLDRVVDLAKATDLVPSSHVKKLAKLQPSQELAVAIHEWLSCDIHDAEAERCFNVLIRYLGHAATWPIATMFGGLVDPSSHTCVRPSVFGEQATMLLPNFRAGTKRPDFRTYTRYLHMAETVYDELIEAGLGPRDLLDVHDFIWETLRPAVRDDLIRQYELPPAKPVDGAADQDQAAEEKAA